MLEINTALRELYRTDSNDKKLILDFYRPGQTEAYLNIWNTENILESFELEESLSSNENLEFGSCEASQVKLTLIDVEQDVKDSEMVVYQVLDGAFPKENLYPSAEIYPAGYVMPLGRYIVQSADRKSNRRYRDIVAFDLMCRFDINVVSWYNSLAFPLTLREFRASLCRYVGVTEQVPDYLPNDGMMIEKSIDTAQLMGRDVLTACEQANGAFGHFDRNGVLQHIVLQPNYALLPDSGLYPSNELCPVLPGEMNTQIYDEQIDPYLLISCNFEEYTVQSIEKVQIRQEEGDIGAIYGGGTNCLTVEGNFLMFGKSAAELEEIARGIYGMVSGRMYIPYTCERKGLPYMEVGDVQRLEFGGSSIVSYMIKRTLKGIFALKDSCSATGEELRGEEGGINSEIIQLKGRAAILKKNVEEVSANLIDLEKRTESKFTITAEQIAAEVKRAQDAEAAIRIRADEISTSVTDLQTNINSQIRQLASQIEMKVSSDKLVASINLELNKTGSVITMNAGHFEFKGQNFFVNLDGSGGAANGNFTWDKDGKISLRGADISGALVSNLQSASVISCNSLGCVYADIDRGYLDDFSFGDLEGNYIYSGRIDCPEINTFSDRRLKQDIRDISPSAASEIIRGLRPVAFTFKKTGVSSMGFIAQEVQEICRKNGVDLPLYSQTETGVYTISYTNYIPLLVLALQGQQREITKLKRAIFRKEHHV